MDLVGFGPWINHSGTTPSTFKSVFFCISAAASTAATTRFLLTPKPTDSGTYLTMSGCVVVVEATRPKTTTGMWNRAQVPTCLATYNDHGWRQGWKKPGFLKKTSPVGFWVFVFLVVFWVSLVFFGFFAQTRGILGLFSVSWILLGASRLKIIITLTN